jgi:NTP pyrophosphatase (non-canonical NTP hydrolase)
MEQLEQLRKDIERIRVERELLKTLASFDFQKAIAANVAARGYREGWADRQYIPRQVCKAVEELGEAVRHVSQRVDRKAGRDLARPSFWQEDAGDAGDNAKDAFDSGDWSRAKVLDPPKLAGELADVLVTLYCAADALGVDLNEIALEKSQADVGRGVR